MGASVLVIDDDADIAEMLSIVLSDEGYDVAVCLDSRAAVATVQRLMPAVILLDLMMPPPSGEELVPLIRGNPKTAHIPIILESAAYRVEERRQALGLRFALRKPLDLDELIRMIEIVRSPLPA